MKLTETSQEILVIGTGAIILVIIMQLLKQESNIIGIIGTITFLLIIIIEINNKNEAKKCQKRPKTKSKEE